MNTQTKIIIFVLIALFVGIKIGKHSTQSTSPMTSGEGNSQI